MKRKKSTVSDWIYRVVFVGGSLLLVKLVTGWPSWD